MLRIPRLSQSGTPSGLAFARIFLRILIISTLVYISGVLVVLTSFTLRKLVDDIVDDIPLWLFRLLEASQLSDLREGGRGDDRQNRCIFMWYLIYLQILSNRYCNSTCHWVVQDIFSHPRWGYDPNWLCSSDYSLLGVVRLTPASRSFPRKNFGHQLVVFHTSGLGVDQLVLAGMGGIRAIDTFVDRRRLFVDRWLYFFWLYIPRVGCWMMMGTFKNVRNPIGTRYIWRDFGAPGGTEKVQWKSRLKWRQGPPGQSLRFGAFPVMVCHGMNFVLLHQVSYSNNFQYTPTILNPCIPDISQIYP